MVIKDEIKNFLMFYKDKWFKNSEIASYINNRWSMNIGELEVRHSIQELRMEGILIIASPNGYKYTKNLDEIGKYLKARWCEVCREMKSFRVLAQSCNMIDQLKIWENENEEI